MVLTDPERSPVAALLFRALRAPFSRMLTTPPPLWRLFGLTQNPFRPGPGDTVVVGREAALTRLGATLADAEGSRVLVHGGPGVGRATFAEAAARRARDLDLLAAPRPILLLETATPDALRMALLGAVVDAVLAHGGLAVAAEPAVTGALQICRLWRTDPAARAAARGDEEALPDWLQPAVVVPPLLTDLAECGARRLGARGVFVTWRVADRLEDAACDRLGRALVALVDVLRGPGRHHLVLDTGQTLARARAMPTGLATLLDDHGELQPLGAQDLWRLVERRCAAVQVDPTIPMVVPIEAPTVRLLATRAEGDVASLLALLGDTAEAVLGRNDPPTAPLTVQDVGVVAHERLVTALRRTLPLALAAEALRILAWPAVEVTQPALMAAWGVARSPGTQLLDGLERVGAVRSVGTDGRTRRFQVTTLVRLAALAPR